jgi:urease beta subunit
LKRNLRQRRAISTVYGSLFFLFISFTILSLIILAFYDYNLAANEKRQIDFERSQEKIVVTNLTLTEDGSEISDVYVKNVGTIEVKIRAIYHLNSTSNNFIIDPSTYPMNTYIDIDQSLKIPLPTGIAFEPNASKIVAATERGVTTMEYVAPAFFGQAIDIDYDPSKLYIGPLMLQFDAFWYKTASQDGTLDPNDPWNPGWSIPRGFGYCAWNITVMNVDDRNITINRFSSFVAIPNDSPSSQTPWYLEPTNPGEFTQFLPVNETRHMVYIWSTPKMPGGNIAQKLTYPETTCMVFLTFYGIFHEHDGSTTPYAQTIPFEAAITVTGK